MSAHYEGVPQVQFLPDGRNVRLTADLVFYDPSEIRWAVPALAVVDGASIPKVLWSVFGGPFEGKYRDASIIHDWYCDRRTRSWQATHRVFYDAMCVSRVSAKTAKIMYFAVRWKGPRWDERVTVNTNLPLPEDKRRPSPGRSSTGSTSNEAAQVQIVKSVENELLKNEQLAHHDYSISNIEALADNLYILEENYMANRDQIKLEEFSNFIKDNILRYADIPLEALNALLNIQTATLSA